MIVKLLEFLLKSKQVNTEQSINNHQVNVPRVSLTNYLGASMAVIIGFYMVFHSQTNTILQILELLVEGKGDTPESERNQIMYLRKGLRMILQNILEMRGSHLTPNNKGKFPGEGQKCNNNNEESDV